jgi:hypothetical protein
MSSLMCRAIRMYSSSQAIYGIVVRHLARQMPLTAVGVG